MKYRPEIISKIAEQLKMETIPVDWKGVDSVLPLIEKIRSEGAIFVFKFDGERERNIYSLVVFGQHMGDLPIATDTFCLETGRTYVICRYAEDYWGIRPD